MRNWFLKTFMRSKIIRVFIYEDTGRLHEHYVVNSDPTTVTIKKLGMALKIRHESVMFSTSDNIPTFICNANNGEPIDLSKFPKSFYSMKEFELAINEKQAPAILKTTMKKGFLADVNLINLIFILCGLFLLGYFMNSRLLEIEKRLPAEPVPIVEVEDSEGVGYSG